MRTRPNQRGFRQLRQRILAWCVDGSGEYGGHDGGRVIERWIRTLDDRELGVLLGTTDQADMDAATCVSRLAGAPMAHSWTVEHLCAAFTKLLEGPADMPAERVTLLRGALLGSIVSLTAATQAARRKRHELTSPLQAALLNLELMMSEQEDGSNLYEEMQTIKGSLDSVAQLLAEEPDASGEAGRGPIPG